MAFVKLDCGMLDSTTWADREAREVFITALLMAKPWEVDRPEAQITVDSLDHTGWSVPAGWYGFVAAAGPGIMRGAGIEEAAGLDALRRLGEPDPGSRSQEFDGRRLVRVNGGYVVLNFMRYHDRDDTAPERSRRYRERQKAKALERDAVTGRDATLPNRDDTPRPCKVTPTEDRQSEVRWSEKRVKAADAADTAFAHFWEAYPRRAGSNPRKAAYRAWESRVASGVLPETLVAAAGRYRVFCEATGKIGTEYVKQAQFWLSPSFEGWVQGWDLPQLPTDPHRTVMDELDAWAAKP